MGFLCRTCLCSRSSHVQTSSTLKKGMDVNASYLRQNGPVRISTHTQNCICTAARGLGSLIRVIGKIGKITSQPKADSPWQHRRHTNGRAKAAGATACKLHSNITHCLDEVGEAQRSAALSAALKAHLQYRRASSGRRQCRTVKPCTNEFHFEKWNGCKRQLFKTKRASKDLHTHTQNGICSAGQGLGSLIRVCSSSRS